MSSSATALEVTPYVRLFYCVNRDKTVPLLLSVCVYELKTGLSLAAGRPLVVLGEEIVRIVRHAKPDGSRLLSTDEMRSVVSHEHRVVVDLPDKPVAYVYAGVLQYLDAISNMELAPNIRLFLQHALLPLLNTRRGATLTRHQHRSPSHCDTEVFDDELDDEEEQDEVKQDDSSDDDRGSGALSPRHITCFSPMTTDEHELSSADVLTQKHDPILTLFSGSSESVCVQATRFNEWPTRAYNE